VTLTKSLFTEPLDFRTALATVWSAAFPRIRLATHQATEGMLVRGQVTAAALVALRADARLLGDPACLDDWIFRAVASRMTERWREGRMIRQRRIRRIADSFLNRNEKLGEEDDENGAEWAFEKTRACVDEEVAALAASCKLAWYMRRIECLGPREIAHRLGVDARGLATLITEVQRAVRRGIRRSQGGSTVHTEQVMKKGYDPRLRADDADDAELSLITDYVGGFMSEAETKAFEAQMEDDEGFFYRVAPLLDFWFMKEPLPIETETAKQIHEEAAARRRYRVPLQRRAVLITPRQPYYDWLATVGSDGAQELKFESVDDSRWPRIFLVPCHLDGKAVEKFIDERVEGSSVCSSRGSIDPTRGQPTPPRRCSTNGSR